MPQLPGSTLGFLTRRKVGVSISTNARLEHGYDNLRFRDPDGSESSDSVEKALEDWDVSSRASTAFGFFGLDSLRPRLKGVVLLAR
jgi:hypothetical protein